jgi:asparagine synthase (glutamine-hydrolysing)
VTGAELAAMDAALSALGPDGAGCWNDGVSGLGHRLMRFTPEDRFERQPLAGGGGTLILVATGRVDDREALCGTLGMLARDRANIPDSALLMRAFEAWGEDTPRRVTGGFAFAVWNSRTRRLFAARSAFGAPPFFYHRGSHGLAFATRPKGLFALPEVPRAIDEGHLADYMVSMPTDAGHCFWRDVRALGAGQALAFDANGLRVWDHWRLDEIEERPRRAPDAEAEELSALMEQVIADHRRTEGRAGVMMSGGLDSTAVAAIAALQLKPVGGVVPTFTEVPQAGWHGSAVDADRYSDEGPYARAMALHHDNLQINLIRGEGFYFDGIVDFFEAAESPFRNASNRTWYEGCIRAAAAADARVLLTGLGGNATVSCDGEGLLRELVSRGDIAGAVRAARMQVSKGYRRSTVRAIAGAMLPLLPGPVQGAIERWRLGWPVHAGPRPWELYSPIGRDLAEETRLVERTRAKGQSFYHMAARPIRERRLNTLRQPDGPGADIAIGHRQMYGVDTRHPLCDRRLVEFCMALPEAAFAPGGEPRGLMRSAMVGRVPREILANRKRGVQGSGWLGRLNENRATIEAELAFFAQSPLIRHALDIARLQRLAHDLPPPHSEAGSVKLTYRAVFESGLMTGRFLRWVESGI